MFGRTKDRRNKRRRRLKNERDLVPCKKTIREGTKKYTKIYIFAFLPN